MNPFGVTFTEMKIIELALGSSYPLMYSEFGVMVNSLLKKQRVTEAVFRTRFLGTCRKGLIAPLDDKQALKSWRDRRYKITPWGNQAIRDIQIATGGAYRYYKYFQQTSEDLDRFLGNKVSIGKGKKRSKAEVFAEHNANPERTKTVS